MLAEQQDKTRFVPCHAFIKFPHRLMIEIIEVLLYILYTEVYIEQNILGRICDNYGELNVLDIDLCDF